MDSIDREEELPPYQDNIDAATARSIAKETIEQHGIKKTATFINALRKILCAARQGHNSTILELCEGQHNQAIIDELKLRGFKVEKVPGYSIVVCVSWDTPVETEKPAGAQMV